MAWRGGSLWGLRLAGALASSGAHNFRAEEDLLCQASIAFLVEKLVLSRSRVSEGRQSGPGDLSSRSEVFLPPTCLGEAKVSSRKF